MRRFANSWACCISAALLLLAAARLVVICASHPIVAYANNYDFVRQSACVGVWEDYGNKDKTLNNPAAPVNRLVFDGDRRKDVCLFSSDNLFPWFVAHLHGIGSHFGLRDVGLCKALVAILLVGIVVAQRISSPLRLSLSFSAFLLFGDVAIASYFDTLYLEASVIISLFAALSFTVVLIAKRETPTFGNLLFLTILLLWLALARQQYSYFVGLIGLVCCTGIHLHWRRKPIALTMLSATVLLIGFSAILQSHVSQHTRQVDRANRVDTFLGAVLPIPLDRLKALQVVGLPRECAAEIGMNWYSNDFPKTNTCNGVYNLSRMRLLPLFAYDPHTLTQPLAHAIVESRPAYLPYLGHFERASDATRLRFQILTGTSFSTMISLLPDWLYFDLILLSCAAGPLCLIMLVAKHGKRTRLRTHNQ
jgi:hypothetical protein